MYTDGCMQMNGQMNVRRNYSKGIALDAVEENADKDVYMKKRPSTSLTLESSGTVRGQKYGLCWWG